MPPRTRAAASSGDPPSQGGRYASKIAFEALHVEEVESDDSEDSSSEEPEAAKPIVDPSPPMTRTAQKKAAKAAQLAAKQAKAAARSLANSHAGHPSDDDSQKVEGDSSIEVKVGGTQQMPAIEAEGSTTSENRVTAAPAGDASNASSPSTVSGAKVAVAPPTPLFQSEVNSRPAPAQGDAIGQEQEGKSPASSASNAVHKIETNTPLPALRTASFQDEKRQTSQKTDKDEEEAAAAEARRAKWKKVWERTLFTFLMIGGFIGLLLLGHPYMILLVMISQTLVYREVTALFNIPGRPSVTGRGHARPGSRASSLPASAATSEIDDDEDERVLRRRAEGRREELWSKTLSWYFFAVCNYFLYGESIIYYFKHIVFVDAYFIPFARHHRFLSFMLYVFGFMAFVSNLKRANLKHQFGLFCWVHMSLLLIVFSSHFIVNNILEGLIWFWIPASLVICNDVFAYICGMTFGRTPLIDLSPKKTVEGFVGAFVITEIFAYGWATFFQRFNYMICPAVSLGMNAFKETHCEINPVFNWHHLSLPPAISASVSSLVGHRVNSLPWTPFQLHALVMAAFASLVAPFGGFFASGFKRAFNIKDFGDSIPGHGGLTDRFDCQFLMGLFSYVYYSSLIREHHVSVGSVLQTIVTHLTLEDQVELYQELSRYLVGQGQSIKL
ncbi:hypothetical protein IE53DRAFT_391041 [Violaceomyces palustris]|uniref:Uncharacterized protein n=1 Tax=Violaceomyces palustris TaxID=1673888 RepID=A0ACD0NLU5_9BASI|nr:hypothetical protein IE53DRAFT_391041 [Violaceomyces palustris]